MANTRVPAFRGRIGERDALDRGLDTVRHGRSDVLVVRGEAGAGKSALLRYAAGQAADFRVVQISGIESEMELPFAGLHQLCASMLAHQEALPEPQQAALRVALGEASGATPDRFLVALAALNCWPRSPRSGRSSASSTMPSGSMEPPARCWGSWPAGCSPSGWRWCSRSAIAPAAGCAWLELASSQARLARSTGTLVLLPYALDYLAGFHIQAAVEWHLRKVFTKLGITSRRSLHDALPSSEREPAPA